MQFSILCIGCFKHTFKIQWASVERFDASFSRDWRGSKPLTSHVCILSFSFLPPRLWVTSKGFQWLSSTCLLTLIGALLSAVSRITALSAGGRILSSLSLYVKGEFFHRKVYLYNFILLSINFSHRTYIIFYYLPLNIWSAESMIDLILYSPEIPSWKKSV